MELAQMKSRIKLIHRKSNINKNGFQVNEFIELKEIWSKVEQVKITERIQSSNEQIPDEKRFIIRKSAEPNIDINDLFIKYKGKLYEAVGYETFNSLEDFICIVAREGKDECKDNN